MVTFRRRILSRSHPVRYKCRPACPIYHITRFLYRLDKQVCLLQEGRKNHAHCACFVFLTRFLFEVSIRYAKGWTNEILHCPVLVPPQEDELRPCPVDRQVPLL